MDFTKIRVLLVEDNNADAKLVQRMLRHVQNQTFEVTTVNRLESAIEEVRRCRHDVLLLDLGLPDSKGISTFTILHDTCSEIPIVIFTILGDESVGISAVSMGAQDYLVKGTSDSRMMAKAILYAIERKRLELKLQQKAEELVSSSYETQSAEENLAQLAAIVEQSDEAIFRKNLDGIILTWNTGAKKMYGYSEEEIIGKPASILMLPERQDEMEQIMEKIKNGETVHNFETVRVKKDRTRFIVLVTITPIKDLNGTVTGSATIARDITELLKTREALRNCLGL
jgi:PAS domain S-box-containing protein